MKRVTDIITNEEIQGWYNGDIITIKAGTGAGKSYFIKNKLYDYAKKENKKILMLLHRTNCVNQFKDEISSDGKNDVIDIKTYQHLEALYKNKKKINFDNYQYIVCDEFHYFMSDASFNKTTDISLNTILSQTNTIRIFMSATGDYMRKYIKNYRKLNTIDYELPIEYKFIKSLSFFNKDETLEMFVEEAIKTNEKAIFFIQSSTDAYDLYNKYKELSIFNCGKSDKHYKHVDEEKINTVLKEQKFEELIMITTTCFDAGVNLIDEDLKHIICDVKDKSVLIQCIGRKRIQHENDRINLYIKNMSNQQLGGIQTQLTKRMEMAHFLRNNSVKDFIEKYPRENERYGMVYDDVVEEENKSTKKVNELMYFKSMTDMNDFEIIKSYGDFAYCRYMARLFGFYDEFYGFNYRIIEEDIMRITLEEYLDNIVGHVMLTKDDRKELIETINVKQDGKLLKSLDSLNAALKERDLNYYIKCFETSRMVDGKKKKFKNAWKVFRMVEK